MVSQQKIALWLISTYLNHVHSLKSISLLDAIYFDFAWWADSDDQAAVLNDTQDTRVQDENVHYACTWFFCTKDLLESAKIWKGVLHSRENSQKKCIGNASVITFECSDFTGQDLASISVKDYVHCA